jgi:hypothetical protein
VFGLATSSLRETTERAGEIIGRIAYFARAYYPICTDASLARLNLRASFAAFDSFGGAPLTLAE